jgi:hypothetical protein
LLENCEGLWILESRRLGIERRLGKSGVWTPESRHLPAQVPAGSNSTHNGLGYRDNLFTCIIALVGGETIPSIYSVSSQSVKKFDAKITTKKLIREQQSRAKKDLQIYIFH